ncbi:MAG: YCF48-related protein [Candidatus Kapabacteria bacterium]|nr:YCF48-related protein [Candidatus Kapabacteria bacterium]
MKLKFMTTLLTFMLFVCPALCVEIDWQEIEFQSAADINCIKFYDSNNGWIAGYAGTIYRTTDAGVTWIDYSTDTNYIFVEIFLLSDGTGWIVGTDGAIFKVNAEGEIIQLESNSTLQFNSVFFLVKNIGWVAGENGIVLKTIDGGENWSIFKYEIPNLHFWSLYFFDEMSGWVVGDMGAVLSTTNGGVSWKTHKTPAIYRNLAVQFLDKSTGWVAGFGFIIKTTDGGVSWVASIETTIFIVPNIKMLNSQIGWAAFDRISVLFTSDGGVTWEFIETPINARLGGMDYVDNNLYATFEGGKLYRGLSTVSVENAELNNNSKINVDYLNNLIQINSIQPFSLNIFNLMGEQVYNNNEVFNNDFILDLSTLNLANGVYILNVTTNNDIKTVKFIIKE